MSFMYKSFLPLMVTSPSCVLIIKPFSSRAFRISLTELALLKVRGNSIPSTTAFTTTSSLIPKSDSLESNVNELYNVEVCVALVADKPSAFGILPSI